MITMKLLRDTLQTERERERVGQCVAMLISVTLFLITMAGLAILIEMVILPVLN